MENGTLRNENLIRELHIRINTTKGAQFTVNTISLGRGSSKRRFIIGLR